MLGFVGGNGVDRLTRVGRLRKALDTDLDALTKLDDGPARDALAALIDREVGEYVTQATPTVASARRLRGSGLSFLAIGGVALLVGLVTFALDWAELGRGTALNFAVVTTGLGYWGLGEMLRREGARQVEEVERSARTPD